MKIVCQQTILMKNNTLLVSFEKSSPILTCLLLQTIGCALWVNVKKRTSAWVQVVNINF